MPSIATYRKQAKLLVRWHRERNYSVGEKVRLLERCRHLSDAEVLAMAMPLTLAQEVVAVEAGYRDWPALRAAAEATGAPRLEAGEPGLGEATPILFVRDVTAAARFYDTRLGFRVDFLHGEPPFYASVSRDRARLHLRFVHQPNFAELAAREQSLIVATITAGDVKALFTCVSIPSFRPPSDVQPRHVRYADSRSRTVDDSPLRVCRTITSRIMAVTSSRTPAGSSAPLEIGSRPL